MFYVKLKLDDNDECIIAINDRLLCMREIVLNVCEVLKKIIINLCISQSGPLANNNHEAMQASRIFYSSQSEEHRTSYMAVHTSEQCQ